ncbi:MAG TPA: hypothetical protein VGM91_13915 [Conexibacter sp.]|jgi:hypothetical protein
MPETTADPSRSRLRIGRRHARANGPAVAAPPVPAEDLAAAVELAREAASPFGYLRPARELLAHFGGKDDAVARATAALAAVAIAADPPLATVDPTRLVRLRRADIRAIADVGPAAPLADTDTDPLSSEPEAARSRSSWAQRTAARHAPEGPVSSERRVVVGALGFAALVVLIAAAVFLRSVAGPGKAHASAAPANSVPPVATADAASPVEHSRAPAAPVSAKHSAAPATVSLKIVPTERTYLCVADGSGATKYEVTGTQPYSATGRRLFLRIGTITAHVTANGRAIPLTNAPTAFELTPGHVRELASSAGVCGS